MSIERRVYSRKEIRELKNAMPGQHHLRFAAQFDGPVASQHRLYISPNEIPRVEHTFITPDKHVYEIHLNYPDGFTHEKKGVVSKIDIADDDGRREISFNEFVNTPFELQGQIVRDMVRATRMLQVEVMKESLKKLKSANKSTKTLEKQLTIVEEKAKAPTIIHPETGKTKRLVKRDRTKDYTKTLDLDRVTFDKTLAEFLAEETGKMPRKVSIISLEEAKKKKKTSD
ncbi:MAG: hypothetical protein GOV15_02170 [Candidatus Diapherotrites archaeon]|nr:hypothetical protein [Candidatus Diapherotrites archaeon]